MKKPVIYYQFDLKKFRKDHYQQGFFDYDKMGFGPVCTTENKLISALKNIENDDNRNVDEFFKYHDFHNCERIYQEIIKL